MLLNIDGINYMDMCLRFELACLKLYGALTGEKYSDDRYASIKGPLDGLCPS